MQKYKARCRRVNGGYVLLKGSSISPALAKSCREGIKKLREEHAKNISADFILLNDIPFKSSSTAAAFVAGASVNGKICWKNKNGVLLKDILEGENN